MATINETKQGVLRFDRSRGSAKWHMRIKNTFIHVKEEEGEGTEKMFRSSSQPSLTSNASTSQAAWDGDSASDSSSGYAKSNQIPVAAQYRSSHITFSSESQDSLSQTSGSDAARQRQPIASAQDHTASQHQPIDSGPGPSRSSGSGLHHLGQCNPCAWQHRMAKGCSNGSGCSFCHMCPPGAAKTRKKEKMARSKLERERKEHAFEDAGATKGIAQLSKPVSHEPLTLGIFTCCCVSFGCLKRGFASGSVLHSSHHALQIRVLIIVSHAISFPDWAHDR